MNKIFRKMVTFSSVMLITAGAGLNLANPMINAKRRPTRTHKVYRRKVKRTRKIRRVVKRRRKVSRHHSRRKVIRRHVKRRIKHHRINRHNQRPKFSKTKYRMGQRLGKKIYSKSNNPVDFGGERFILNNRSIMNRSFRKGYRDGYFSSAVDDDTDISPAPGIVNAIKVSRIYQTTRNKMLKRGIRDGAARLKPSKPNKRYKTNRIYMKGFRMQPNI